MHQTTREGIRMKIRSITLILLLALATLCQFAFAQTNEGDWTPTNQVQWWWKYVLPADGHLNGLAVVGVNVVQVRSDHVGFVAHRVTFTLQNRSKTDYRGGDTFQIEYMNSDMRPAQMVSTAFKPAVVARGILPYLPAVQHTEISH